MRGLLGQLTRAGGRPRELQQEMSPVDPRGPADPCLCPRPSICLQTHTHEFRLRVWRICEINQNAKTNSDFTDVCQVMSNSKITLEELNAKNVPRSISSKPPEQKHQPQSPSASGRSHPSCDVCVQKQKLLAHVRRISSSTFFEVSKSLLGIF